MSGWRPAPKPLPIATWRERRAARRRQGVVVLPEGMTLNSKSGVVSCAQRWGTAEQREFEAMCRRVARGVKDAVLLETRSFQRRPIR